jgi:microcystin-dependent protein
VADPFVAEIRILPFSFAPAGWAFCDGQLLQISQNTALFSLLGTTYGGNGKSNFALPDLQGAAPMHPGQGPGLSVHDLGESGGSDAVILSESEMPAHSHAKRASAGDADLQSPGPNNVMAVSAGAFAYHTSASELAAMGPEALAPAGGDGAHNNLMPYLTLNFCIALQGVFPPRNGGGSGGGSGCLLSLFRLLTAPSSR